MGKSFELLGLATVNIFIAIFLSTTFLSDDNMTGISRLNESNVTAFVNEVAQISGGQREEMDAYGITSFLMKHIKENGRFRSHIDYEIPDFPETSRDLEMDRNTYISHILQVMEDFEKHEAAIRIENVEIEKDGRSALVITTNYERGVIPVQGVMGDTQMLPVTGMSFCEQELVLSENKAIQMANATCDTNIAFVEAY